MTIIDDHLGSIDEALRNVRLQHEAEKKSLQDQLLAAQIELQMYKDLHQRAVEARAASDRLAVKLITQFGLVEKVFFEAKELSLAVIKEQAGQEKIEPSAATASLATTGFEGLPTDAQ